MRGDFTGQKPVDVSELDACCVHGLFMTTASPKCSRLAAHEGLARTCYFWCTGHPVCRPRACLMLGPDLGDKMVFV